MTKLKRNLVISWILFGVMLSSATGSVADETPVNLRNAGGAKCSDLITAFEGNSGGDQTAYLQWAAGYATAVAQSNNVIDVYPLSETRGLVEMALLICREPHFSESRYQTALLTAIARLKPFWARNPSIVTITNSENLSISIYQDAVKPLQQALIGLGVQMPADGNFGAITGRAFTELQKLIGLPETSLPNGISLYALTKPKP